MRKAGVEVASVASLIFSGSNTTTTEEDLLGSAMVKRAMRRVSGTGKAVERRDCLERLVTSIGNFKKAQVQVKQHFAIYNLRLHHATRILCAVDIAMNHVRAGRLETRCK